jgi:regulator of sigma E protease
MFEKLLDALLPFFWSLGSFLLAIVILIAVHEWGHFYLARKLGVRVLRFSIGFGRPLWSRTDRQGTEYVVAGIPIGGYVKMLDEREGDVPAELLPFSFGRQPVWKRSVIVAAGPVINLVFAFLLYWVLFLGGENGGAPLVGKIEPGSTAALAGLQQGQEIMSVDGVSTLTRDAVFSALVARLGESGQLVFEVGQPGASTGQTIRLDISQWMTDSDSPDPLKSLGFDFFRPPFVNLVGILPGSAAERAGLRPGDIVEIMDGSPVSSPDEWVSYIRQHPELPVRLGIRRGDALLEITVSPARIQDPVAGQIGQIGAQVSSPPLPAYAIRHVDLGVVAAGVRAVEETIRQTSLLARSLYKLVAGDLSPKNLSGPLGIAKVTGASADMGLLVFCQTLAVLSISLGIMNLLPIPMLDGGHLLLYLVESIKGSPVSERVQALGNQVGMLMLASLMLFAMYNDILKIR